LKHKGKAKKIAYRTNPLCESTKRDAAAASGFPTRVGIGATEKGEVPKNRAQIEKGKEKEEWGGLFQRRGGLLPRSRRKTYKCGREGERTGS